MHKQASTYGKKGIKRTTDFDANTTNFYAKSIESDSKATYVGAQVFILMTYLMYWIHLKCLMHFIFFNHSMAWIYLIDRITHRCKEHKGARAREPCASATT